MKSLKYITGCSVALLLLAACSKDEGPSIDDYFLNYEIPDIPVTEDYQVGIFYNRANDMDGKPNGDANFTRWQLLTLTNEELNGTHDYSGLTPQVMPESQQEGFLKVDGKSSSFRMIPMVQQHVDGCIEAGADFMILPEVGVDINKGAGTTLNDGDSIFVTMMLGESGREGKPLLIPGLGQPGRDYVDLKSMKIVISVNWNNIVDNPTKLAYNNCIEDAKGITYQEKEYPRQQVLENFFCQLAKFFDRDHYYKVGGTRPMLYIKNKTGEIYAQDSKAMYDGIRRAIKERTGYDVYLVAESAETWCNQVLYQYFYMEGCVDAVASRNMYDQSEMSRSYWYPQMIDQNWKYNRESALPRFGDGSMEYIPTVGPAWNKLVQDGRGSIGNTPIVNRDPEIYRTICNVAKMNAGRNRLILIDSYNKYNFNSFIEPTVEDYGKGYGKQYLELTRKFFKKN